MGKVFFSQGNENLKTLKKDELIENYIPLVKKIATGFAMRIPPSITLDELISAGNLGLIDAAGKFDSSRHVDFKTYASFRIKGSILDELRNLDNYSRSLRQKTQQLEKAVKAVEKEKSGPAEDEDVAEYMGLSIKEYQDLLTDVHSIAFFSLDASIRSSFSQTNDSGATFQSQLKGNDSPEKNFNDYEKKKILAEAIDRLPEKERTIISLYYYEGLTLKEIGEIFGRTESRICQIHSAAIIKLKSKLKTILE